MMRLILKIRLYFMIKKWHRIAANYPCGTALMHHIRPDQERRAEKIRLLYKRIHDKG